jgi:tetratricopeptide (TPR) repeat protein
MNRKNEVSALLSKARAAAQQGNYAGSFFNLGSALALSDQIGEAAEAYRKAVRITPRMAAGHCGLADALFRLGKFDEAGNTAKRSYSSRTSIRLSTTSPASCLRRATPCKRSS